MKAILLAGGKGTRLRPLTIHTPKPIVPIFNRPFLHYQIDLLQQVPEIDEVILSLNYQPRRIEEIFGDGERARRQASATSSSRRRSAPPARSATRASRSTESVVVFNGDVLTQVDLAAVLRAAPRAQGEGDDRADAGREPARLRPGRDRRRRQRPALPREAEARRDHLQHDQRRHLRPRARHLRPHPEGHGLVDRAQLLPVARSSAARRSSPTSTTATGSTSARRRSTCRCTATSWTAAIAAPPFDGRRPTPRGSRPRRGVEEGVDDRGAVLRRRGRRSSRRARASAPYSVIGRQCHVEEDARHRRRDRLGERLDRPRGASSADSILGRHCHVGRNAVLDGGVVLGDKSVVTDYSRL